MASLSEAILALSPAGYWRLDESGGTTATDSSGNSRNGTYGGTYTLRGRDGFATFNSGYVNIPDNNAWTISATGLTLFCLVYVNATQATQQTLISKMAASNYEWESYVGTSTKLTAEVRALAGGTSIAGEVVAATFPVAGWHRVAIVLPGTPVGAGERFPLYIDTSTAAPSNLPTTAAASTGNGSAAVRLGSRATNANYLIGALGHCAIFPAELTPAQVDSLMTASLTASTPATGTGSLALTATATVAARVAAVTGSLSLSGAASAGAQAPAATGSLTLSATATAMAGAVPATATGSLSLSANATVRASARATGSLSLSASATAKPAGAFSGSLTLSGTATARARATASGSLTLGGGVTTTAGGRPKVRVGGVWLKKPAKERRAGAWVTKPTKVRVGGVWKTVP